MGRVLTTSTAYPVARRTYWRTGTVVMACIQFNATQDTSGSHWFDADWQPRWWGGKVLTIREYFVKSA